MKSLPEAEVELFFAANTVATAAPPAQPSPDASVRLIRQKRLDTALVHFRMAATNLSTKPEELAESKEQLFSALSDSGLLDACLGQYSARMEQLKAMKEAPKAGGVYLQKRCYQQQLMHEIVRGLFVSSYHAASDKALLLSQNVGSILSCINVTPKLKEEKKSDGSPLFKFMVLSAEDNENYDMSQHFDRTFQFIDETLGRGAAVLVYCGAGISRAPTIAAAYLIRKLKLGDVHAAIDMIQKVRIVARPNNNFQKQLASYAKKQQQVSLEDDE